MFRVRELLIRQRTQAINALRGHLSEFGQIVPQGAANAAKLIAIVEDPECDLPADAIPTLKVLVAALAQLEAEIGKLDTEIARRAKENELAWRLMTVPGIGPLIATAIATLAPPPETFRKARDFAASCWKHAFGVTLGLTPRQHSTGGKQRLGATTRMGERSLKGETYRGMHEPIVDADLWNAAHAVLAGNRNQRAGRTRSTEPALLRGLIFTQTGAAMTPHHTKKGNKRYCYYVSMDVIQKRPTAELRGPQRLPAAMVEEAVIGEIRRLLRTPEIIARTARALKKERPDLDEGTVTAALTQFDDLWKALIPAEQARVVQLLVARVTVGEDGLDIDLRHDGLGALASLMTPAREDAA